MKFYSESKEDVLKELSVNRDRGLSSDDVKSRRDKYGLNEFTPMEEGSFWDDLKDALSEPMIVILIIAAIISAVIGEFHDAIGIVCAIAIGIAIGMITEGRSKKAAEALSKLTENIEVKVLRDGEVELVSKSELVPGDIVFIETGDMIPADGRLIKSINLKVREDMLTGESDDVSKKCDAIIGMEKVETKDGVKELEPIPAKQINMVFGGTLVAYGTGMMVVTSIGDNTQMGDIAKHLSGDEEDTPLQIKLGNLGGMIAKISSAIAGLLFIFMVVKMVLNGLKVDTSNVFAFLDSIDEVKTAFTVCVALIVAAVPEGLPTMINMTLAITMQKMAKINALVTKKEACETIGSVSVICSDKTGTLTQNKMTVVETYFYGPDSDKFNGFEYNKNYDFLNVEDTISSHSNEIAVAGCMLQERYLNLSSILCNDSDVNEEGVEIGDPTEVALINYAQKYDLDYKSIREECLRIAEIPFDSDRKLMTTVNSIDGQNIMFTKGAPDVIFSRCKYAIKCDEILEMSDEILDEYKKVNENFSNRALRVLAFAYKKVSAEFEPTLDDENDLILIGLMAMIDPPREEVFKAVDEAKSSGIKTIMITGDHKTTAAAIAREIGIMEKDDLALTGKELDSLDDTELDSKLERISVYARVSPENKIRIVKAWQKKGKVTAMTGDGVNDAPALKQADIGIGMGSGTEVAKDASAMVLVDDNFATIGNAIEVGRTVYSNIKKSITYLFSGNLGGIISILFAVFAGWANPFTTIQLLFINLVTDSLPAIALGFEKPEKNTMNKPPRDPNESILCKDTLKVVLTRGSIIGIVTILAQYIGMQTSDALGAAMAFSTITLSRIIQTFAARSNSETICSLGFTSNKYALGAVIVCLAMFSTTLLPFMRGIFAIPSVFEIQNLAICFGLAVLATICMEISKLFKR